MPKSPPSPRPPRKAASALWSLTITTHPEAEDAVGERLFRMTRQPAVATHSRITGLSSVTAFLGDARFLTTARRRDLREALDQLAQFGLQVAPAKIQWRRVPPEDWRESWKKHFPPLRIGKHLIVRPSWTQVRRQPGQAELILDPGLSFGTGQHPTTEFCLREIVRLRPRSTEQTAALLDVGTGSGILALAAARLGYRPVEAFDFDPDCVVVAHANARRNRLTARVKWSRRDVAKLPARPRRSFAVVCANLTADLLDRHATRLVAHVAPGGTLILAGILAEEFATLRDRFIALGLEPARTLRRREWQSGSFRRI